MHIVVTLCLSAYVAVLGVLYAVFNVVVPDPYMDEPFHVGQTKAYCAGYWSQWDAKITTFPGLYASVALCARARAALTTLLVSSNGSMRLEHIQYAAAPLCELPALRAANFVPALASPMLMYALLQQLHPEVSQADTLANSAILALLPTHFFFHFLFYTDSAATASVLLLMLMSLSPATRWRQLTLGPAAALALSFRQTNIVWIFYAMVSACMTELAAAGDLKVLDRRLGPSLVALLRSLPRHLPRLCIQNAAPLILLGGFSLFVVHNGSVVLGDKANHQPVCHGAQLLYITSLVGVPFEVGVLSGQRHIVKCWSYAHLLPPPCFSTSYRQLLCDFSPPYSTRPDAQLEALSLRIFVTIRAALRAAVASPLLAAFFCAMAVGSAYLTFSHPFLLADNRHVTFALWRHVLGTLAFMVRMLACVHVCLCKGWVAENAWG